MVDQLVLDCHLVLYDVQDVQEYALFEMLQGELEKRLEDLFIPQNTLVLSDSSL